MEKKRWQGMIGNTNGATHGMSKTQTYNSWVAMISRCTRPKNDRYKNYGGRGIKVCDEWMTFSNFLRDMGVRPEGTTLDRKNVNGDYNKENCQWSDRPTQYRNTTKNHFVTLYGVTKTISEWAKEFKTSPTAIQHHINRKGLEFMYQWRFSHGKPVPNIENVNT